MLNYTNQKVEEVSLQGKTANANGRDLENFVEDVLNDKGIKSLQYKDMVSRLRAMGGKDFKGVLIKNAPYTNMYGGKSRGEFLLHTPSLPPVRIECRSQQVHGSVDEKIPYLLGNCIAFEESNVIIVLDGKGMRPEAKQYLISACKALKTKRIEVMSKTKFAKWVNTYLK